MNKHSLYNKRWRQRHRAKARYLDYRGMMRCFLRNYATADDLHDVYKYCQQRLSKSGEKHDVQ